MKNHDWERLQVWFSENKDHAERLSIALVNHFYILAEVVNMDGEYVVRIQRTAYRSDIVPFVHGFVAALKAEELLAKEVLVQLRDIRDHLGDDGGIAFAGRIDTELWSKLHTSAKQ